MPGCLHHTLPHNRESGFLAFIRFIGTCYFKKHLPAFITLYGHETPKHLYNSIDSSLQPNVKHELWLKKIRNAVSNRITNKEERVPSFTSLWCHWLRSCWVSQMWQNFLICILLFHLLSIVVGYGTQMEAIQLIGRHLKYKQRLNTQLTS